MVLSLLFGLLFLFIFPPLGVFLLILAVIILLLKIISGGMDAVLNLSFLGFGLFKKRHLQASLQEPPSFERRMYEQMMKQQVQGE